MGCPWDARTQKKRLGWSGLLSWLEVAIFVVAYHGHSWSMFMRAFCLDFQLFPAKMIQQWLNRNKDFIISSHKACRLYHSFQVKQTAPSLFDLLLVLWTRFCTLQTSVSTKTSHLQPRLVRVMKLHFALCWVTLALGALGAIGAIGENDASTSWRRSFRLEGFLPPLHEGHLSNRACCVVNIIVTFMLLTCVLSSSKSFYLWILPRHLGLEFSS